MISLLLISVAMAAEMQPISMNPCNWDQVHEAFRLRREDQISYLTINWGDLYDLQFFYRQGDKELKEVSLISNDLDISIELATDAIRKRDLFLMRKKYAANPDNFCVTSLVVNCEPSDWRDFFLQMSSFLRLDTPLSISLLAVSLQQNAENNQREIRVAYREEATVSAAEIADLIELVCKPPEVRSSESHREAKLRSHVRERATRWQVSKENSIEGLVQRVDDLAKWLKPERKAMRFFRLGASSRYQDYPDGHLIFINLDFEHGASNLRALVIRYNSTTVDTRSLLSKLCGGQARSGIYLSLPQD